jgi:hypothetical protein
MTQLFDQDTPTEPEPAPEPPEEPSHPPTTPGDE